ncbi:aldehyde dehydrogenase family protein [Actinomadura sp. B10D3]|uniref:aldehyde dehydrogenase family protein n=1 Tax=Actinomadura sp. B10D3 TaxID=3153557 RepID=UPI00325D6C8A
MKGNMISWKDLYIGGQWVRASGAEIAVVNPATEEPAGVVVSSSAKDLDDAVAAARRAFDGWRTVPVERRLAHILAIAEGMRERQDELVRLIATEMGAPVRLGRGVHTGLPISVLESHRTIADSLRFSTEVGNSLVVREPRGVVAAITPWNFPLHQIIAKLAPALLAGCTVVLKPSLEAPLSTYALCQIIEQAGLPDGVVNLVIGRGAESGEALVRHPGVDMVSFTGSTDAGRRIGSLAADLVRPVTLELGGKSANVILEDADLPVAVKVGVANAFMNAGQTCSAWTRMLVPRSRLDVTRELIAKYAVANEPGDPMDPATRMGPVVSARQRESVLRYIDGAVSDGCELLIGGVDRPHGLDRGFYVRPTVFVDVPPDSRIAREEVFGPVLAVLGYETEEEALELANDSSYGLAGAVWAKDRERALDFAREMETGQVDVNGGRFNPLAPFGGYKRSGIGREFGTFGVEEYLQVKSIQL